MCLSEYYKPAKHIFIRNFLLKEFKIFHANSLDWQGDSRGEGWGIWKSKRCGCWAKHHLTQRRRDGEAQREE
jgi:hypothetical protein